jgi:hypothetical protein
MSSTNRGSVRPESDYYGTPEGAFRPLLHLLPHDRVYWDPACGDWRLIRWMEDAGLTAYGSDIEPKEMGTHTIDFLTDDTRREIIITNPPFSLAQEFVQHAMDHAPEVLMLLRLNFLGSIKRREWLRTHEPSALFVVTPRPSFTGGGTDSCEYAWFYWGPRWRGIHHP